MFSFLLMKICHCSAVSVLLDIMHLPCYHCQVTYNINCALLPFTNSLPWPYGIVQYLSDTHDRNAAKVVFTDILLISPTHLHKLFSSPQTKFGQTSRKKKTQMHLVTLKIAKNQTKR